MLVLNGAQHLVLVIGDKRVDVGQHDFVFRALEARLNDLVYLLRPCVDLVGANVSQLVGLRTRLCSLLQDLVGILQLALEVEEILIRVVLQNIFQVVRHRHEEVVVELLVIKAQQAINDGGWVRHLALAGQRTQNRLGALRQSQNVGADAEEAIRQLVQLRHQTVAASEGVAESVQNLADVRNTDCSKFAFNGLKNPVRKKFA